MSSERKHPYDPTLANKRERCMSACREATVNVSAMRLLLLAHAEISEDPFFLDDAQRAHERRTDGYSGMARVGDRALDAIDRAVAAVNELHSEGARRERAAQAANHWPPTTEQAEAEAAS
jgi:hypothetical protein